MSLLIALSLGACVASPPSPSALPMPEREPEKPAQATVETSVPPALAAASDAAGEQKKGVAPPEMAAPAAPVDYEGNVYFEFGKIAIDQRGKATLIDHAKRLKEDAGLVLTLIAHTDHLGSRAYNQAIAEERLDAAVRILRTHGVAPRQIRRRALGNEKSHANRCRSEACRRNMRRIELIYEADRIR